MKKTNVWAMAAPLAMLLMVLSLAGCQKKAAVATQSDPNALEPLKVLKLPAGNWTYVATDKGWIKEEFEDKGIKVELVQGVTGNEVQLFSRGDIHFTSRMLYPYLLYRSQGADLIAVQASTHPNELVASIIVKADSPYKTVDDLRGKKIASWRAGCPYMVLYEIMERKGWKEGTDWTYSNIREYRDAFLADEVDAFSAHATDNIAALLTTGVGREIANPASDSIYVNGGGVTVHFTTSAFARDYPNITKKYLELLDRTYAWIYANQDEAAAIVEKVTRAPANVTKFGFRGQTGNWTSEHDLAKVIRETEVMQDWLIDHGDLDGAKRVNVPSLFATQYF